METVEIIEIDEDTRLKVVTDDSPDDPRGWGWDVEFHAIDNYRIWRGWEHPEDPTAYAAWQYQQEVRAGRFTPEQRDRALKLYQSLTGDTRSFEIKEHRGYSQSDWATYLVIGEADALGLWETFDPWLKGMSMASYLRSGCSSPTQMKRGSWTSGRKTSRSGVTTWMMTTLHDE